MYAKAPNIKFSRHILATAQQKTGQSLREFLQNLQSLSKDCNFRAVTGEEYRQEMVRDSFINGLTSTSICQRLLENRELDLQKAFAQASALEMAQRHSQAYEKDSGVQVMSVPPGLSNEASLQHGHNTQGSLATVNKPCFFCGGTTLHLRKNCPACNSICFKRQKKRHFSAVLQE